MRIWIEATRRCSNQSVVIGGCLWCTHIQCPFKDAVFLNTSKRSAQELLPSVRLDNKVLKFTVRNKQGFVKSIENIQTLKQCLKTKRTDKFFRVPYVILNTNKNFYLFAVHLRKYFCKCTFSRRNYGLLWKNNKLTNSSIKWDPSSQADSTLS
jgi:hypothetical protein